MSISCTSAVRNLNSESSVHFNSENLPTWEEAKKDLTTAKSPATYIYEKNGKKLIFLASQHSNKESDPGFAMIQKVVSEENFNVAILESFPASLGFSPASAFQEPIKNKDGTYPYGEPSYAAKKLKDKNIPYVGGEVDDTYLLQKLIAQKFQTNDYLAFTFLRSVPGSVKSNPNLDIKKHYDEYMPWKMEQLGLKGHAFSWIDFNSWYQKNFAKAFVAQDIVNTTTSPVANSNIITQTIAVVVNKSRDEFILSLASELFQKHDAVLIIYGSSHYRIQKRVIEDYFGSLVKTY